MNNFRFRANLGSIQHEVPCRALQVAISIAMTGVPGPIWCCSYHWYSAVTIGDIGYSCIGDAMVSISIAMTGVCSNTGSWV